MHNSKMTSTGSYYGKWSVYHTSPLPRSKIRSALEDCADEKNDEVVEAVAGEVLWRRVSKVFGITISEAVTTRALAMSLQPLPEFE